MENVFKKKKRRSSVSLKKERKEMYEQPLLFFFLSTIQFNWIQFNCLFIKETQRKLLKFPLFWKIIVINAEGDTDNVAYGS